MARAARGRRRPVRRRPVRRPASSRRRRRTLLTALILAPLVVVAGISILIGAAVHAFGTCRQDALSPLDQPIATLGYTQDQLDNARTIVTAGHDLDLSVRDQAIGVMTALGESSLHNIDYGDWETSGVTNPDGSRTTSIGLFQQQDSWGTRDERLDPYTAATMFYRAMVERVPDRADLSPTEVAHRTQINADADHYERYWPRAVRLVEVITGADTGLDPGDGAERCT